jgi:hypothetical protein
MIGVNPSCLSAIFLRRDSSSSHQEKQLRKQLDPISHLHYPASTPEQSTVLQLVLSISSHVTDINRS